ncbi:sulfatase-like hydrolase/transferase [Maribellus comscasis]|uniref:Sulfatase-like hydrolase/transferase n=1 Tax=Maribellus comscasis TaxID=2681766 RepID=A0A6I6JVQ9_9BACT|nr:sulfatase-like hydrolase/transferase [Maribellus comscasis]QGY45210.1 sulfatase-like hydrolase/transferase [Maribellus comscasis]
MCQKISIFLFCVLIVLSCKKEQPKPNIILISADDLGWSDIGCYGSEVQTPNLDKLGEGGIRFTRFHNTSKCFPLRACLLTGVYAQQNGYSNTHTNPITNAVTLGEVLRTAGYRTLWSGKHHGLENPFTRGFDRYYGLKDGACNYFNPGDQRPGEGAPARKGKPGNKTQRWWCIDSVMYHPYTPEAKDFYTTDYFTNYALGWLDEYKNENKPFFLYLAFNAPHDPLMAWPEDIAKYKGKYDAGYEKIRNQRYQKQLQIGLIDDSYSLSAPTYDNWEDLADSIQNDEIRKMEVYAAMIDRMDQNIGRLLAKLKETKKDENTLILFVSDNGASAEMVHIEDDYGEIGTMTRWSSLGENWANVGNTPFRFYKNFSYEGGINTPLIAWWPGKITPKTFSEFPGHFIDIMATVVDITGATYPAEFNNQKITPMQGVSLLPVLNGEKTSREKPIFWEWRRGKAVYSDSWKIVKEGLEEPWDLYNIEQDPTETKNLANSNPEKVKEMEQLFEEWKSSQIEKNE